MSTELKLEVGKLYKNRYGEIEKIVKYKRGCGYLSEKINAKPIGRTPLEALFSIAGIYHSKNGRCNNFKEIPEDLIEEA